MVDLANLLAKKHDINGVELCLPRQKITFQFDNCNENKVIYIHDILSERF
jgi:hypothetical protein